MAEEVKSETRAETAPTTPQINRELGEIKDRFGELMTGVMRAATDDVRARHGDFLEKANERREEAEKAQNSRKSDDRHVSTERGNSPWVAENNGLDFGAVRNADRESKVGSYAATASSVAPRAEPAIARKVA